MRKDVRYHGFVTIQSRGVVALPSELRKRMHLDEPGAQLELTEREDGVIEVRAQMAVPVAQRWFWTEQWQQREREAEADVAAGRVTQFEDAESFLDALPD
jgi:bifunctional DNA-binding transcriptional regulator/antitoxin component of YhaV-PrlF toxin-antitoxin module